MNNSDYEFLLKARNEDTTSHKLSDYSSVDLNQMRIMHNLRRSIETYINMPNSQDTQQLIQRHTQTYLENLGVRGAEARVTMRGGGVADVEIQYPIERIIVNMDFN